MSRPVWIDLSRLIWRARSANPTGIDRVEMAYARHFMDTSDRPARFLSRISALGAREFDRAELRNFLDKLQEDWRERGSKSAFNSLGRLISRSRKAPDPGTAITVIPSHQNWHRRAWLEKRRGKQGKLVLFLHDLIPSQYPEYARAGGSQRHEERLVNALGVADGFITNSLETRNALTIAAGKMGHSVPNSVVAPIGTRRATEDGSAVTLQQPYFLTLGTIEPRKNHMLLLLLWRRMAEAGIADLPKLVIAGRRGWENEQIVDLLERSRALQDLVIEKNDMGDAELCSLIANARALLMPSFAEGFGMPVNEALAAGTPVIASNLPVFKETAGNVPDYCDPLDGAAWQRAILAYSRLDSPQRQAQIERMRDWQAPGWDAHFEQVEQLLSSLE